MSLAFTQPVVLWGVLLIGIVLLIRGWSLVKLSKGRTVLITAIRVAIVLLLVLGLSGMTLVYPARQKTVLFLLDESLSIDESARDFAVDFVKRSVEGLRAKGARTESWSVMSFASQPGELVGVKDFLRRGSSRVMLESERGQTNLSAVLEQASVLFPADRVPLIVLLSDGNETVMDALATVGKLKIPVSTVTLPGPVEPDVQVGEVRVPSQVRQGEPFSIEVVLWSNCRAEAEIILYRDGIVVGREKKSLVPGETILRFERIATNRRQEIYTAQIQSATDTVLDNNLGSNIVFVGVKPRILFIDADQRSVREYVSILRRGGMDVVVRPPEGIPSRLEELNDFDLIILSNVSAWELNSSRMKLLGRYVHDSGGGLLVAGGDQAFGPGGYADTELDSILPVSSRLDRESQEPSLAVCLVLDRSGSMGGRKLKLASQAARSTAELLGENDLLGVVMFDREPSLVWGMQKARRIEPLVERISQIEAGAGTSIYPALVEGFNQLDRVEAKRKHLILLSDGHSEPGDFDGIVEQMTARGVTVSTIGVGQADSQLLERMARGGHGRFYSCKDFETIPRIFVQETNLVNNSPVREEPFVPKISSAVELVRGVDFETAPPLLGFVTTVMKPNGRKILQTDSGKPLLAWCQYGLGICCVFTSDVRSIWSADWLSWSGFPPVWQGLARRIMRRPEESGIRTDFRRNGEQLEIAVDALDQQGRFLNARRATASLTDPHGNAIQTTLIQTAPGYYEASFPWPNRQGVYHVRTTLARDDEESVSNRGVVIGCPAELLVRGPNTSLLKSLAVESGGLVNPGPLDVLTPAAARYARGVVPLWPWLFAMALFLYFPELILRRLASRSEGR